MRIVENNARLCGVIIDWDTCPKDLCQRIHAFNDFLPVYAFSNSDDVTDASMEDLKFNVEFFEYGLSCAGGHRAHDLAEDPGVRRRDHAAP